MASLKYIRTRISSIISTRQITNAMKMVAAARLKRAQDAIISIRPYANKLQEIMNNTCRDTPSVSTDNIIYTQQKEVNNVLIIVFTSNRGLCGAFNSNVIKKAIFLANEKYAEQFNNGQVSFIAIGKKAYDILKSRKYNVINDYNQVYDNLDYENISLIAQSIMQNFLDGEFDRIDLVYNQFKNAAVQILIDEQFLPVNLENAQTVDYDYIYEPTKEQIVKELIPKSIKIQFYKALLDSHASEHGARMTAMHIATDNATELIRDLRLNYNKARQSAITKEILEIVGGAEALKT